VGAGTAEDSEAALVVQKQAEEACTQWASGGSTSFRQVQVSEGLPAAAETRWAGVRGLPRSGIGESLSALTALRQRQYRVYEYQQFAGARQ
jgi:hypothetical protein